MSAVKVHKTFWVHCEDCGFSQTQFHKRDVKRVKETHDCVKYLRRSILSSDVSVLSNNFDIDITVTRRGTK
jgi:hypothetical protein